MTLFLGEQRRQTEFGSGRRFRNNRLHPLLYLALPTTLI